MIAAGSSVGEVGIVTVSFPSKRRPERTASGIRLDTAGQSQRGDGERNGDAVSCTPTSVEVQPAPHQTGSSAGGVAANAVDQDLGERVG